MLKGFKELSALDLSGAISKKPTFKKQGGQYVKTGELDYLNWADCLQLLYTHGAERVEYDNVLTPDGHPVFLFNGTVPFIRVYVVVDDHRAEITYPLIDGSRDITLDKLAQSDVHNATQRAFVKCVAINWGLGLSLWQKEEREEAKRPKDDLDLHRLDAVRQRIEQKLTGLINRGMSINDVYATIDPDLKANEKVLKRAMEGLGWLAKFEQELDRL